jgi:hypothetical protein
MTKERFEELKKSVLLIGYVDTMCRVSHREERDFSFIAQDEEHNKNTEILRANDLNI